MKFWKIFLIAFFAWPILFISGCLMEPLHHGFEDGWNLSKKWRQQREAKESAAQEAPKTQP